MDFRISVQQCSSHPCSKIFGAITIMILTSCIGGAIFHSLEHDAEVAEALKFANASAAILQKIRENASKEQTRELFEAFEIIKSFTATKQTAPNLDDLKWTVSGSTFFAFTVLTTIGYGSFAPNTSEGKIFTCFFALFGVVVSAWALSVVVSCWKGLLEYAIANIFRLDTSKMTAGALFRWKACIVAALFFSFSLLMAAWANAESRNLYGEEWGLGNSYYFTL